MSEWEEKTFDELAEITSSKRIFYSDYVSKGIPFYRSKEIINKHNRQEITNGLFIAEKKFEEIKTKYGAPRKNDILLTSVGTLGIPYKVKSGDNFYFKDGNLTWFRNINQNLINVEFLYIWFQSKVGLQKLEEIAIGSTQPALTIRGLKTVEILLPPLPEQKAIAEVLSSLDDKIDLLHRQNKTLEQMAETLFRQWFMEEAQEDWEDILLGEAVDIAIGRTPPRKQKQWFSTDEKDIKWISIKDMGNSGPFIFDTSEYLTIEAVDNFNIPIIPKDTVVLSFKMTLGRVRITSKEMLSNEAIAHFKFKNDTPFSKEYLYLFLKTYPYQTLGSTSSIVTSINSKMIKDLFVFIPDKQTLLLFDKQVKVIFNKIKSNQLQIRTLESLRDTLLPKLMSGKIRVSFND